MCGSRISGDVLLLDSESNPYFSQMLCQDSSQLNIVVNEFLLVLIKAKKFSVEIYKPGIKQTRLRGYHSLYKSSVKENGMFYIHTWLCVLSSPSHLTPFNIPTGYMEVYWKCSGLG